VAGLLWWTIRHDGVEPVAHPAPQQEESHEEPDPLTDGDFEYTAATEESQVSDCEPHSYGEIHDWFGDHPCEQLDRGLYTTAGVGGERVLVAVSVVTMTTHDDATELYELAFDDGTGNVADLAREREDELAPDAPEVAEGQYKSKIMGSQVTIVEANFFGDGGEDHVLTRIAADARRLSDVLT